MACVLVDVDGTLVAGRSCERRFVAYLLRHGKLGPPQLAAALKFQFHWAPRYGRHCFKKNKAYLAGLPTADIESLAEVFVRDEVKRRLRRTLLLRLESHRAAGDTIALLTGTPDFIARPLARTVGIKAWSATRCAQNGQCFTDDPPLAHPFAEEKLARARELCAGLGSELADCVVYADSGYDLPLLEKVGRPIAVCPDSTLARAARRQGWEILEG